MKGLKNFSAVVAGRLAEDGRPQILVLRKLGFSRFTFPGGDSKIGEKAETAARRELAEEASLEVGAEKLNLVFRQQTSWNHEQSFYACFGDELEEMEIQKNPDKEEVFSDPPEWLFLNQDLVEKILPSHSLALKGAIEYFATRYEAFRELLDRLSLIEPANS